MSRLFSGVCLLLLSACAGPPPIGQTDWSPELGPASDWPRLLINELMSRNSQQLTDEMDGSPDWVELYNPTAQAVDLTDWTITDTITERDKHVLSGLRIEAGGWLLLYADDEPSAGDAHLSFKLSGEGEELGLYTPEGGVSDELDFGELPQDESAARIEDGGPEWTLTDQPTPGWSNTEPEPDA